MRSMYHNRIPNGIAFEGSDLQDRFEIFLIPGTVGRGAVPLSAQ